jgi:vitamin K-dependent gamma-carboxylase
MTDAKPGILARLASALLAPKDAAGLAAFRVLFGIVGLVSAIRFEAYGWVDDLFVAPRFHFHYWGASWARPLGAAGMHAVFAGLMVASACVALGLFYRVAIVAVFLGVSYVQLVDVTNYLNHYYLVVLVSGLMALLPLHRAFSVDAWLRPSLRAQSVPAWMLWLLRFQFGVVWFFGALAKLQPDWLLHAQPMGIWLAARSELPLLGPFLVLPGMAYALSWAGFLFDLTIVPLLLARRTRPFAYAAVLVFHCLTHLFFDIGLFPFLMVVGATLFFEPDWPRRLVRARPAVLEPSAPTSRWALGAVAAYGAFQLLFPLRHHLYPGNVLWAEEGMRFAWKIMVREKNGSITYHVRDPRSGRAWQVSPFDELEWRQASEMSGQPDLILQYAHHLAETFRSRGLDGVEVRAEAWVSLNGRKSRLMIDPQVDLAAVPPGLLPARWILPSPTEPPLPVLGRTQGLAVSKAASER